MDNTLANRIYALLLRHTETFGVDKCWKVANKIIGLKNKSLDNIAIELMILYDQPQYNNMAIDSLAEKIFLFIQPRTKFMDLYNSRKLHPSNNKQE